MGRYGVIIFFVHTSLVLMLSLERLQSRGESIFSSFYLRRCFRIYPLSMFWVAVITVFHLASAPWWPWVKPSLGALLANLTLCMNLFYVIPVTSVLWSLPYEVQMYVVLPVLFLLGRRYGMRGLWFVWVLAVGAAFVQPRVAGRLDIVQYAPCFLAGVMSYFLGFKRVTPRLPFMLWLVVIAASAGLFIAARTLTRADLHQATWAPCLLLGLTVPYFHELRWKPLKEIAATIAKYSYGIYLTHLQALWVAFVVLQDYPAPLKWSVLLVLSVSLPVGLYHFLEAPMIRVGARISGRLKRRSALGSSA